jgi:hypothetical protein
MKFNVGNRIITQQSHIVLNGIITLLVFLILLLIGDKAIIQVRKHICILRWKLMQN